jgi:hypothetical protein
MTSSPRRPGFRLPWSGTEEPGEAAEPSTTAEAAAAADATGAPPVTDEQQPTSDVSAPAVAVTGDAAAKESTPADAATQPAPAAVKKDAAAPGAESPSPFLRSLVEAMRGVAEETRARSLAELKAKVEQRIEHLEASGTELAEDLRRRSELDVKGIGDWERGEIERIRGEAARKVDARRQQLEQQLVERQQTTEREIEATRARLGEHERELSAFVAQLTEINDPSAFVAAAQRMPKAPSLETALPASAVEPAHASASEGDTLSTRLALLGVEREATIEAAPANGTVSNGNAASAHEEPGETTTAIVVAGLGSFGAITSFKQSLEKSVGVRSVALSLGPSGEFVYRATHAIDFDIEAAIREVETNAASIEHLPDGTLRVTVVRAR